ncbi:MAG: alanine/glycine:cation symporter family protein [Phycisphaerales bacterium]
MDQLNQLVGSINGILFHEAVVFVLLATGILFTLWTAFGQYRALTHGTQVVRGVYDSHDDPGAINHFQALSAALSATVGLGNIGGVALAVALGGPGAVFWMWVIGVVGMALKMTEVTQSMLYRNTSDPDNPHGGPMFVAREGFKRMGLGWLGSLVGGVFVITLLISAVTGGNMFQSWNVAEVSFQNFSLPRPVTGIILSVLVGLVIIGGIKRIGSVAGRIVPAMCGMYFLAAVIVIFMNLGDVPGMLKLIVTSGLGLEEQTPGGAFLGGTFGYAAMWGIKRALFSSEAGQGSSPIAHAAAKTDEPVREGVVAGIEPFIDTIVVCTLTALVILTTGAWNRDAEGILPAGTSVVAAQAVVTSDGTEHVGRFLSAGDTDIRMLVDDESPLETIAKANIDATATAALGPVDANGIASLPETWILSSGASTEATPTRTEEARRIDRGGDWQRNSRVFVIIDTNAEEINADTGNNLSKIYGHIRGEGEGDDANMLIAWEPFESATKPELVIGDGQAGAGLYGDYAGAGLTSHAFDRAVPGLGLWLVSIASWLFALSTMISWSYYGEQGIVYLGGGKGAIFLYKIIYCLLILVSCLGFIRTDAQLDAWTTLGLGVMLWANIPIMLIFGSQAMKAYHGYMGKLKRGEFTKHAAPSITDVVEGKDVE